MHLPATLAASTPPRRPPHCNKGMWRPRGSGILTTAAGHGSGAHIAGTPSGVGAWSV